MNNSYILTRRNLNPTAKLLARELGIRRYFEPRNYAPVIRWGNSEQLYNSDTEYNSPDLIKLCSNKVDFHREMISQEIPHIEFTEGIPNIFPIVVRQTLWGTRGEGIVICENINEFNRTLRNRSWTYWYNFTSEYGVHMLGGEIVRIFKKVREEGLESEKYPIRNLHRGYHYSLVNMEGRFLRLKEFMRNIYERFPLEMGRWDIGWDENNRTYRVIEANSAPGLAENENTLNCYVEFLKGKIK